MVVSASEEVASRLGVGGGRLASFFASEAPVAADSVSNANDFFVDGVEGDGGVEASLVDTSPLEGSLLDGSEEGLAGHVVRGGDISEELISDEVIGINGVGITLGDDGVLSEVIVDGEGADEEDGDQEGFHESELD